LPKGKTLYDWVTGFLDAGAHPTRCSTSARRPRAAGTARQTLAGSAATRSASCTNAAHPKLPADLESRIFSYLHHDELNARRTPKKDGGEEPPAGETA
jgi:hypothetical protein